MHITLFGVVVCAIVALIVAFIATGAMRSELKSVDFKETASSYTKENSLNITDRNDRYLYKNISKREKTKK